MIDQIASKPGLLDALAITRTIRRRTGEAKAEVLALTEQTGELLKQSVKEARRLAATAQRKARGRGAQAKLRAARALDELANRCEKVATQIKQRVRGEKITDRLISLADPDARPMSASITVESILTARALKRRSRTAASISALVTSLTVSAPIRRVSLRTVGLVGHPLAERDPTEAPQMNRV